MEGITWLKGLWILVISGLCGWFVAYSDKFTSWEYLLYDALEGQKTSRSDIPLIHIVVNERSEDMIAKRPNYTYARLLGYLEEANFVLLDAPLTDSEEPVDDMLLAEAIAKHGKVGGSLRLTRLPDGNRITQPLPTFADAFKRLGISDLTDERGVRRKGVMGMDLDSQFIPSFALIALEELQNQTFPFGDRNNRKWIRFGWKNVPLIRSESGFWEFWINRPGYNTVSYDYDDVLNGVVPSSMFNGALVFIDGYKSHDKVLLPDRSEVSRGTFILRTVASMLSQFTVFMTGPLFNFCETALLVALCSILGFSHFKRNFIFLFLLYLVLSLSAVGLFLSGRWIPIVGPLFLSFGAYIMSQAMMSWNMYNEWNVRSLSIRPLLALAEIADSSDNFDDYLRSLWNDIEENTGVTLKSTRINENFSLVQNYLSKARHTLQQGGESFYIIKNASDTSPRHRMLLPLPMWNDLWNENDNKKREKEYVILAWDGNIAMENLTSLAAMIIFAAVHFHAMEERQRRKNLLTNTIDAIMAAVEAKDPTTKDHSRRVAERSREIAKWMNLSPREIEDIHFAAQIHDIGKLGIADSILKKPGRLTEEEVEEMHKHPSIGEDIMRPVGLPEHIVSGITQHHECSDGKGYPFGIKGEKMTMVSKIIKVADVYDALSNRRQYKEPWTMEEVRQFLLQRRGTEFDAKVVDTFLEHI